MFTKTKFLSIHAVVVMLLLIAVQCAGQPTVKPPPAPAETEVQAQAAAQEQGQEHEHEMGAPELAPVLLDDGEKLKVVATTSIVADIVRQVGADKIDLTVLLPEGSDPHSFEATPRDLATIAHAHVVFANGMGLEAFLDEILENAGGKAATVYVSQGIEARQSVKQETHEHEPDVEEHDQHSEVDPHTWMTPINVISFVHNIEQALSTLDPANATAYKANAKDYETDLEELDAWIKAQIETIPIENRKLVTDHTVFGYYADRYGLEQVGAVIPATTTAAEPSAKELAELEDVIKAYHVKAVFVGNTVNPSLSEQVARDTGTRLLTLYTGSLGSEGSGAESYLAYIKYNTNTIVEGLK